jgi:Flp pilus assembly protein TadD/antitoxin component of MazEF toxin-antitoxin module
MGSSRDATAEGRRREPQAAQRAYTEGELPRDGNDEDFLFHLFRGSELLQDGRELEAKEELEQALLRKPGDEKGQDLLAFVYFRIGIYPRAIAIYEHLRQKSPHDPALHLNLSLCYLKTGQPERARDELEALVSAHADHPRAWGYLGLALERLGDYARAQQAFEKSGHSHLARRMMERAAARPDALRPNLGSEPARDVRAFAKEAYEELDAGQLDFALAEPHASSREVEDWRAIELGGHPPSTRDGPPGGVASMASPVSLAEPVRRRQTLVVAPPPPGTHIDTFLVAPPSRVPVPVSDPSITWTSRPAEVVAPPPSVRAPASVFPPPSASQFAKAAQLVPRDEGAVSLHGNGSVIARPTRTRPFATRLEAIRTMTGALDSKILERRRDGASLGETFGGLGSPLVELAGDGQVIIGPKPGHVLSSFVLEGVPCTLREDRVLGFELGLVYENDKLVLPSAELRTVRFSGAGALVIEAQSPIATIEVAHDRPVVARREVVVGWLGHLDVAPVLPADAPGAHHGLVRLTGSGSVLVSGL